MRNYSYIYESAQLENFERQILSGHLSEAKLIEMYENNQLSDQQIKVVQELFGGLGNIGRAGVGAIGSGLKGISNQAGKIKNAAAAGITQAGQNISNMYKTGEEKAAAEKRFAQLNNQIKILEKLVEQHIDASPYSALKGQNLDDITLGQLKLDLRMKSAVASGTAAAQRGEGFTGGVGSAMAQAYRRR